MNTIEVLDENDKKLTCEVIKIIKNDSLNKTYIVYKDNEDILVSELINENDNYQIKPVLDDEWGYIEKELK